MHTIARILIPDFAYMSSAWFFHMRKGSAAKRRGCDIRVGAPYWRCTAFKCVRRYRERRGCRCDISPFWIVWIRITTQSHLRSNTHQANAIFLHARSAGNARGLLRLMNQAISTALILIKNVVISLTRLLNVRKHFNSLKYFPLFYNRRIIRWKSYRGI